MVYRFQQQRRPELTSKNRILNISFLHSTQETSSFKAPHTSSAEKTAAPTNTPWRQEIFFSSTSARNGIRKNIVLVDGCRLPFKLTGTDYKNYLAVDLSRMAMKGLLTKTAHDPSMIDYIFIGTTIQETKTSNIAREAAMGAGIPINIPANTVTQACISGNQAITSAAEKIISGQADIVLVGGVDTLSDPPIRFSKPVRERLLQAQKVMKKGTFAALGLLKGLKFKDLGPEAPAIANFTTGEVMGHSSDRLAEKFGVSRHDQDEYTVRSHTLAAKAHADGLYKDEITPVHGSTEENGIKGDTTMEKVSKLKPAFRKDGTHTAANSSFLTDGASAALIMSEEKALELGYKPLAYIRDWTYVGADPFEEMLLGPTYATKKLLMKNQLSVNDIDVYEIHEAFAGQVLSNLVAMESVEFAKKNFQDGKVVGKIPMDKINTRGGSVSIGHPFGATGVRILTTAARRLQYENKKYGLLTACADGGLAHAALIERYE